MTTFINSRGYNDMYSQYDDINYDHFFHRLGSKTIFMHWFLICLFRDEIALLHSHLLFERQRREVLGARNRRLLGQYSEHHKTVEYGDKIKALFVFGIVMNQTALPGAQNQLNKWIGSVWTAQLLYFMLVFVCNT